MFSSSKQISTTPVKNLRDRDNIAFLVNIGYASNTTSSPIMAAAYKDGEAVYKQTVKEQMVLPDRPSQVSKYINT